MTFQELGGCKVVYRGAASSSPGGSGAGAERSAGERKRSRYQRDHYSITVWIKRRKDGKIKIEQRWRTESIIQRAGAGEGWKPRERQEREQCDTGGYSDPPGNSLAVEETPASHTRRAIKQFHSCSYDNSSFGPVSSNILIYFYFFIPAPFRHPR